MASGTKDELISVREAAKECGRNMETVRRWIWSGKLPAEKLGNQLFIKRSDLASYCRETTVQEYKTEPKTDFLERAIAFRSKLRARGVKPINTAEEIRKMREDRMTQIEQALYDTNNKGKTKAVAGTDFLERAITLQERIKARGAKPIDAVKEIRKIREERMDELEQRLR